MPPKKTRAQSGTKKQLSTQEKTKSTTSSSNNTLLIIGLSLAVIAVSVAIGVYQFQHQIFPRSTEQPQGILGPIRTLAKTNVTGAIDLARKYQQNTTDEPRFVCEEARLLANSGQHSEAIPVAERCWNMKTRSNEVDLANSIVEIFRATFLHTPLALDQYKQAQLLIEAARVLKKPYGLYLASKCKINGDMRKESVDLLQEARSLISDSDAWGIRRLIHYDLITGLFQLYKYEEAVDLMESLLNTQPENWRKDVQFAEYYGQALLVLSNSKEKLASAIKRYENVMSYLPSTGVLGKCKQNLSQLYILSGERKKVLDIQLSEWESYWDRESQEDSTWNCIHSAPRFIPNLKESDLESVFLPEQQTTKLSTPISMLNPNSVEKSSDFEQPIPGSEIVAYSIPNAKVQQSRIDSNFLLTVSKCKLHGFANIWKESPPVGFQTSKVKKEIVSLKKATLLHWKPTDLKYWIVESLPKLEFLLENEWFGEPDRKVILPFSKMVAQYLKRADISSEKHIHWIRPSELVEVEDLLAFDFQSTDSLNQNVEDKIVYPIDLLPVLKERFLEEPYELDSLVLVVLLRPPNDIPGMDSLLLQLEQIVERINQEQDKEYLVVDMDTQAQLYHQLFAFKRAKIMIGFSQSTQMVNALWLSEGSALVEIPQLPVQRTDSAVLAAQVGAEYWVVPELSSLSPSNPLTDENSTPLLRIVEQLLS